MATYYIIHSQTREVVRTSREPFNIDPSVQPPAPYLQLVRVDDATVPAYDPATQKIVRQFTDDDNAFTRTFYNAVVAMTVEEQAAYQKRLADEATLNQIKAVYLNMKNGVGTAGERLQRVEKACAWLLRQYVEDNLK